MRISRQGGRRETQLSNDDCRFGHLDDHAWRSAGTAKLTDNEREQIQRRCGVGRAVLERMPVLDDSFIPEHTDIGGQIMEVCSSPTIKMARTIAMTYHERWDGTGYPLGLSGEHIPIEGRITAVADVFDAVSSQRPYKKPFSLDKCLEILAEGRGTHFDPQVLDAFLRRIKDIVSVQIEFADVC